MNLSELLAAIRASTNTRINIIGDMGDDNYRRIRNRMTARQVEAGRLARECPQCVLHPSRMVKKLEAGEHNG